MSSRSKEGTLCSYTFLCLKNACSSWTTRITFWPLLSPKNKKVQCIAWNPKSINSCQSLVPKRCYILIISWNLQLEIVSLSFPAINLKFFTLRQRWQNLFPLQCLTPNFSTFHSLSCGGNTTKFFSILKSQRNPQLCHSVPFFFSKQLLWNA